MTLSLVETCCSVRHINSVVYKFCTLYYNNITDVTEEEWYNVSNIPNTEYCIEETCCGLLHNSYILHHYHITQSILTYSMVQSPS